MSDTEKVIPVESEEVQQNKEEVQQQHEESHEELNKEQKEEVHEEVTKEEVHEEATNEDVHEEATNEEVHEEATKEDEAAEHQSKEIQSNVAEQNVPLPSSEGDNAPQQSSEKTEEAQIVPLEEAKEDNINNARGNTADETNPNGIHPEMYANALECAQSSRVEKRAVAMGKTSASVRYLRGIGSSAKSGNVESAHELLRELEEEDARLFSSIPSELKPRAQKRLSDGREGSLVRRAEYHNANYTVPEKHESLSPRRIVDVRRPLTARYDPVLDPKPASVATSRYHDLSALSTDPLYSPGANSRRAKIEESKQKERQQMVKPHSPAQLARRYGPPPKEQTFEKKAADWYPAIANLAESKSVEGKARRQEVQSRMSTYIFK